MKKYFLVVLFLFAAGCASNVPEVRRLSPVSNKTPPPALCRLITVIKESPANKAGLVVGDQIQSVNGKIPSNAPDVSELVAQSTTDVQLEVKGSSGSVRSLQIHLNDHAPRLGAVCDLTGWQTLGVTSAGNESLTSFNGPFALTASGIVDKGLVFLRLRFSNNSDHPVTVTRTDFTASDGNEHASLQMSPTQVMCFLYGEKGAALLVGKREQQQTLGAEAVPAVQPATTLRCAGVPTTGLVPEADNEKFAEANAEYVAQESFWTVTVAPGGASDGLIYFPEPPALPLTIMAQIENFSFRLPLGVPQPRQTVTSESDLIQLFSAQKKGAPLRLTLKKGDVFVGKFISYDADNERVWFKDASGGFLKSISFPVTSIRSVETLEDIPTKAQPTSTTVN